MNYEFRHKLFTLSWPTIHIYAAEPRPLFNSAQDHIVTTTASITATKSGSHNSLFHLPEHFHVPKRPFCVSIKTVLPNLALAQVFDQLVVASCTQPALPCHPLLTPSLPPRLAHLRSEKNCQSFLAPLLEFHHLVPITHYFNA